MSKNIFLWLSVTLMVTNGFCQVMQNDELLISFNKTTSIVFPFSITSVDRGSRDVLAQKASGVENVLQVKAGRRNFPETNLTVITSDGLLHQFTVSYSDTPTIQTITVGISDDRGLIFSNNIINARDLAFVFREVQNQKIRGKVEREKKYQMVFSLKDIFIQNDILFFRIRVRNNSAVNYDIKSLKFFIKDRKKVKRTSSQEIEVIPVHVGNDTGNVKGHDSAIIVYALRKFTIPDGKTLYINLFEDNGGRNLRLKVDNKDILKANGLPVNRNL